MNLFSRFLGRKDVNDLARRRLVANPDIKKPLSLQVLFADPQRLDADRLLNTLKAYHPTMSEARCEIDVELSQQGTLLGMLGWGKHIVRLVGFNAPMPAAAVETCVAPSHYPKELKERARSHQAHAILFYAGYEASPFDRYVALAAAAGVLARLGALAVLNESGHTSLPAAALSGSDSKGDIIDHLRSLPDCGGYGCARMERDCWSCRTWQLGRAGTKKGIDTSICSRISSAIYAPLGPDSCREIRCRLTKRNTSAFAHPARTKISSRVPESCLSPT